MSQPLRVLLLIHAEAVGIAAAANREWIFTALAFVLVLFWTRRLADAAKSRAAASPTTEGAD